MISVFDYNGNMIYNKNNNEISKEHIVDISGLPKGVYVVKVFTEEGEFTKHISIN